MIRNFERSLSLVLKHEGGFSNHPADNGGATNLGITIKTARRLGIDVDGDGDTDIVDIRKLRTTDAAKVYRREYWNKVAGDKLPDGVDYAVFDFAVNSGPSRAARYLQKVLGVKVDGAIGPVTLAAAADEPAKKIIHALCSERMAFLRALDDWPVFRKGWTSRVDNVRETAIQWAKEKPRRGPGTTPPWPIPPQSSNTPAPKQPEVSEPKGTALPVAVTGIAALGILLSAAWEKISIWASALIERMF